MQHEFVKVCGMELERWTHKSCTAEFGVGDVWATLYAIISREPNKGHTTELLKEAREYYTSQGKVFGGTVALNDVMRHLYEKLNIREYRD